jgi:hypothetical protein
MKWYISVSVFITCLSVASWAVAGDPQAKMAQVAGNHDKYADQTSETPRIDAEKVETPSLLSEIRAVVDSTRNAELALREEFTLDPEIELTRRLGDLKRSSGMRILHIQLEYAQKEGKMGLEKRIRTSIEDLQRPAAPGGPRLSGRISPLPEAQAAVTPAGGSQR